MDAKELADINKDRSIVSTLHQQAMRTRNVEALTAILATVNVLIGKYENLIKENKAGPLSSYRVVLNYLRIVQKQTDRRALQLQRSYNSRNAKMLEQRQRIALAKALTRLQVDDKIDKYTQALDNPMLAKLSDAGYDPTADIETRRAQAEALLKIKYEETENQEEITLRAIQSLENREVPTGEDFLKLLDSDPSNEK